jgi:hypothetical protein
MNPESIHRGLLGGELLAPTAVTGSKPDNKGLAGLTDRVSIHRTIILILASVVMSGCATRYVDIPCGVQFAYKDIVHPTPAPSPKVPAIQ